MSVQAHQAGYAVLDSENEPNRLKSEAKIKNRRFVWLVVILLLLIILVIGILLVVAINSDSNHNNNIWLEWSNTIAPHSIPFNKSTDIIGWEYLNNSNFMYGGSFNSADTWYPSWSQNGNIYSPFTAGTVFLSKTINFTSDSVGVGINLNSSTGYAIISGDTPNDLTIIKAGIYTSSSYPYEGRYPCGSLVYNDIWFYGTCFLNGSYYGCGSVCLQGPLVGYRWTNISNAAR
eukprot:355142_1